MGEELTPQKEKFLQEVEQKLLRRDLDARLLENGLIHVRWNEKPLCSVDRDGIVRFRPADITGPEVDKQLRTVIQAAGQVKEYMRVFERASALKAISLDDTYQRHSDKRKILRRRAAAKNILHGCDQQEDRQKCRSDDAVLYARSPRSHCQPGAV